MESNKDLKILLKYIPIFENESFNAIDNNVSKKDELLLSLSYSDEIYNFIKDFYKSGSLYQFNWSKWQKEALEYFENPELLKKTDIITIQKLLTLHIRKERFCEGHLIGIIKSGHMVDILKRLAELVKEKV